MNNDNNIIKRVRIDDNPSDLVILKPDYLIRVRYKMTGTEYKLFAYAMAKRKMIGLSDNGKCCLNIGTFLRSIGTSSNGYAQLKLAAKKMSEKKTEFKIVTADKSIKTITTNFLKCIPVGGNLFLTVDEKLDDIFTDNEGDYTKYKFGNILKMRSQYSIRLYEIFKMTQKSKSNLLVAPESLRKIIGIPETTYGNLKNRIRVSIKEINDLSDLDLNLTELISGHDVVEYRFEFKQKEGWR